MRRILVLVCVVCSCVYVSAFLASTPYQHTSGAIRSSCRSCIRMAAKKEKKSAKTQSKGISLRGFSSSSNTKSKDLTAASSDAPVLLRDEETLTLYKWLEVNGVDMRKIALAQFEGLRGVMALKDINKGELILDIPYVAAIDLGDEGSDPTMPALNLLKVWCDPENRWKSYLTSLPKLDSHDLTTTDYFTDEELKMLQWPPVIAETQTRLESCASLYKDVIKMQMEMGTAFHGVQLTLEHLKWAVFIVVSRVLTVIREDDVTFAKLLIPGIDMFNHSPDSPHILTGRAAPGATLKIVAGVDIKAGSQINISYGGKSPRSDRFIQDYGFIDPVGCREQDQSLVSSLGLRPANKEALAQTSIQQDIDMIIKGGLTPRAELAIRFRLALKKLIV